MVEPSGGNGGKQKDLRGKRDTESTGLGDWEEGEARGRREGCWAVGKLEGPTSRGLGLSCEY